MLSLDLPEFFFFSADTLRRIGERKVFRKAERYLYIRGKLTRRHGLCQRMFSICEKHAAINALQINVLQFLRLSASRAKKRARGSTKIDIFLLSRCVHTRAICRNVSSGQSSSYGSSYYFVSRENKRVQRGEVISKATRER